MISQQLISLLLPLVVLSGCATVTSKNKFAEFKNTNWAEMNRMSAEKMLGMPDTMGVLYRTSKEALIYLSKDYKAPQLVVIFDNKTNKILSVYWYANAPADKLTLDQVRNQFPGLQILDKPVVMTGAWGKPIAMYSSIDKIFEVDMNRQAQKLYSLSWRLERDETTE